VANSAIGDIFAYVENKLKTEVPLVIDPLNVVSYEEDGYELEKLEDSAFPRLNLTIIKSRGEGYVDQFSEDESFRLQISGYMKRPDTERSSDDLINVMDFAEEVKAVRGSINADKVTQPVGFPQDILYVGSFTDCFYDREFVNRVAVFMYWFDININLNYER